MKSPPLTKGYPIKNFRWIDETNQIGICAEPSFADMVAIQNRGITHFIILKVGRDITPPGVDVDYIPINFFNQFFGGKALETKLLKAQRAIRPHTIWFCVHGVNRSGTLEILELEMAYGWTKANAIAAADEFGWKSSMHGLKQFTKTHP